MPEESSAAVANPAGLQEIHVDAPSNLTEMAGTESFADLERAMGEEPPPAPAKDTEAKPVKAKPATGAEKSLPKEKPDTTTTGSEKSSAKDATEESTNGKPLPAPELRKAYQDLKTKHAQLQSEYETFKKTPRDDPERKTLAEKLQAAEKHRNQLDEELKHAAYERSDEFKKTYHDPFVNAYQMASEVTAQLEVTDAEGNVRAGTAQDFDTLMQIPNAGQAKKWAEEMFGTTGAAILMNQRMEVVKVARAREAALQEARKMGAEREKSRLEASTAQQRALAEKWSSLNNEASEKYPQWFKEVEGDDKGNELLKKGYELADAAFNGANLSPEKMVELHSAIRNRAAAFGRVAYQNKQQAKRISELEAKLKEYESSEPGPGEGKADGKSEPGELDWERSLETSWRT